MVQSEILLISTVWFVFFSFNSWLGPITNETSPLSNLLSKDKRIRFSGRSLERSKNSPASIERTYADGISGVKPEQPGKLCSQVGVVRTCEDENGSSEAGGAICWLVWEG